MYSACPSSATVPDRFVLFTDTTAKAIYRMDLTTRSYVKIPLPSHNNPIAIDYDYIGERIYWTDVGRKMIRSATLDGLSSRTIRMLPNSEYTIVYLTIIFIVYIFSNNQLMQAYSTVRSTDARQCISFKLKFCFILHSLSIEFYYIHVDDTINKL